LSERLNGHGLVVHDLEDGIQPCNLHQIVNLIREVEQLQFSFCFRTLVKALTRWPNPELSMSNGSGWAEATFRYADLREHLPGRREKDFKSHGQDSDDRKTFLEFSAELTRTRAQFKAT
jgi:hypothetical protein